MASIDTHLVRKELRAIAASSKAIKKLLYDALERLEQNPSQWAWVVEFMDKATK